MQQLMFLGAGQVQWREVSTPRLDSDLAAVVRPVVVATCDLDAEIVRGRAPFEPPFPLGHEGIGEVVEVGDQVRHVRPGQLVVIPFQISCGTCSRCKRGRTGHCESVPRSATYGFGPQVHRYGGFLGDVVAVPFADHMLVELPQGCSPLALASASDNIPDAWRAVGPWLARDPGADVLVVGGWGAGSIGLYTVALARALGAGQVVYVDDDERRCRTASECGAEVIRDPPRRLGPFPITVSATGSEEGLGLAIRSTAAGGRCTSTGIFLADQPVLPMLEMYEKGITLRTGRSHARPSIPAVLDLVAKDLFAPELITTKTVPWEDAADAIVEPGWAKLVFDRTARYRRPSS